MAIYIAVAVIILFIVVLVVRRMTRAGEPGESVRGVPADEGVEPVDRNVTG